MMVRRVIRMAIVAWLVGAGMAWARRQGGRLGTRGQVLHRRQPGGAATATSRPAADSARALLTETAAREAASAGDALTADTAEAEVASDATAATADVPDATAGQTFTAMADSEPATGDDLKVIEGIGPRFDAILRGAGVESFAQLAALDAEEIRTKIRDGGGKRVRPATWPEQARLAAGGEWEALAQMQARLKGGREAPPD
jgi:predicted flap endonuclease-1-like 5' DNA nuclease